MMKKRIVIPYKRMDELQTLLGSILSEDKTDKELDLQLLRRTHAGENQTDAQEALYGDARALNAFCRRQGHHVQITMKQETYGTANTLTRSLVSA